MLVLVRCEVSTLSPPTSRRIREVQPIINAVVEERFDEALKDAEEVDTLVASGTMSPSQMDRREASAGAAVHFQEQHSDQRYATGCRLFILAQTLVEASEYPAAYCGIFAHKPTAGVVPNTGLFPDAGDKLRQFNCVGPMTRFAEDLPLMLNVLAGSPTNVFRLSEKVNLNMLKLYYMDTEGSLYISRITSDVRKVVKKVTQYLKETHGLQPQPMQIPEMRFAVFTLFKVAAAKEPQPLSEMYRPGGFNTLVELFRLLVGAGRHTLAALVTCKMASLFRFRSEQEGEALVASLENARDRFEEKLGDNGVLVLPAATSAALFRNQDVLIFDSPDTVTLFNLFQAPATVCPVMRSVNNLPLCVQVVAKRGNDRLCLAVAREIEKHFGGWMDPSDDEREGRISGRRSGGGIFRSNTDAESGTCSVGFQPLRSGSAAGNS
ncbi:hypothetical protein MRX96_039047 [Rhipicephalus microplus]